MLSHQVYLQGLGMGASLIMPIGAQNAHVIRTGVSGRHVGLTVAACILIDATLIGLGMAGLGRLVESSAWLLAAAHYGGAAFLLWYGLRCWTSAARGGAGAPAGGEAQPGSARRALLTVLAMSLLNPHVYLDTVVLLGAVGGSLAAGHRGRRDDGFAAVVFGPWTGRAALRLYSGTARGVAGDRSIHGDHDAGAGGPVAARGVRSKSQAASGFSGTLFASALPPSTDIWTGSATPFFTAVSSARIDTAIS
jgi:L-lysine exporter family protein LysE/ArgO